MNAAELQAIQPLTEFFLPVPPPRDARVCLMEIHVRQKAHHVIWLHRYFMRADGRLHHACTFCLN